jgi:DNA-directed RNA polymerase specialized sigma24 family protein
MLGFSVEEVADACAAPVNTVRSRLRLAKEALRDRILADATLKETLEGS